MLKLRQHLLRRHVFIQAQRSAQFEPLHHLTQIDAVEIGIETLPTALRISSRATASPPFSSPSYSSSSLPVMEGNAA